MDVERIALIGTMGAGKTTVGTALAARLGWRYLDNDALLREAAGASAHDLLAAHGEAALRVHERAALRRAVEHGPGVVLAVAAGTAAEPGTRSVLSGAAVVWLRARPATVAARVVPGELRPWLHQDPLSALTRLDEARREAYAALATLTVDVDELTADEVVQRVLDALA